VVGPLLHPPGDGQASHLCHCLPQLVAAAGAELIGTQVLLQAAYEHIISIALQSARHPLLALFNPEA